MKEIEKLYTIKRYAQTLEPKDAEFITKSIDEFILANTDMKIGKLKLWDWVMPKKSGRPSSECLCYNDTDKEVCATDHMMIIVIKSAYTEAGDTAVEHSSIASAKDKVCRLLNRNGEYYPHAVYPNYFRLFAFAHEPRTHLSRQQCTDALRKIKALSKEDKTCDYFVEFSENVFVEADKVKKLITLPNFEFEFRVEGYPMLYYNDGDIRMLSCASNRDYFNSMEPVGDGVYRCTR